MNYERIPVSKRSTHSRFTRNSEANSGNKPPICVGFWLLGYLLKHAEKKRFFDQKIQTTKFFEIIGFKKGYHYVFFRKTKHGLILAHTAWLIITRTRNFCFFKEFKIVWNATWWFCYRFVRKLKPTLFYKQWFSTKKLFYFMFF